MSEGRIWRVGVIGAGKHGSRYARHIVNDVDGFELAAISRRSEEGRALAGQWGCRWHADWQDLINDPTVDCLIAALPPMLNREVAAACALARKPLLLEKPMACTVAVEQVIDEHYARQATILGDDEKNLRDTIEEFRAEELQHRDEALAQGAEQAPAYPVLSAGVKAASRLAIWLSSRF